MTLEADQAVQEASFAGACQDQHAGRPAPSLGWPGEKKSIVHERKSSKVTGLGRGARVPGLGAGLQGLGLPPFFVVLKKSPGEGVGDG